MKSDKWPNFVMPRQSIFRRGRNVFFFPSDLGSAPESVENPGGNDLINYHLHVIWIDCNQLIDLTLSKYFVSRYNNGQ